MIIGIGTDILQIGRLQAAYDRTNGRLAEKILGPDEMLIFQQRLARNYQRGIAFLATRFAAKEALVKALGGPSGLRWTELQVSKNHAGRPVFLASGQSAITLAQAGVVRLQLSISHDGGMACAFVVAEARDE